MKTIKRRSSWQPPGAHRTRRNPLEDGSLAKMLIAEIDRVLNAPPPTPAEIARRKAEAEAEAVRVTAKVLRKAEFAAQAAVGQPFRVRTGKNSLVQGTIVECKVAGTRRTASAIHALFAVVLEGPNGTRHRVTVREVPR